MHAGHTPLEVRRDAFIALTKIIDHLYALAEEYVPWGRATFGDIKALPGSRNTVPEQLVLAVDLSHPDQTNLNEMDAKFRKFVAEEAAGVKVDGEVRDEWNSPAVQFDKGCITAVKKGVETVDLSHKTMMSGAGHDSVYVSRVAQTFMIFVPRKDDISHNEAEDALPAD